MIFLTRAGTCHRRRRAVAVEDKNIMYRSGDPAPPAQNPNTEARRTSQSSGSFAFSAPTRELFMFRALTYNSHRIHYDQ